MNTIENNKLIAEFMGFEPVTEEYFLDNGFENDKQMIIDTSDCKYETSWDWLMPVVDKIEITSVDGEDNSDEFFNVVIEVFECNINGSGRTVCGVGQNKIEATYKAVVEFIKWYNKNK